MWFKNLRVYRIAAPLAATSEALEAALGSERFRACSKMDFARYGFVPPLGGEATLLSHTMGQCTMFCARKQEKILPPGAIRELVDEKVVELEAREGRKVFRRERSAMKDDVVFTLLPRALTHSNLIYGYFDEKRKLLIVDAASPAKAEEFLDGLRSALGDLPAVPLDVVADTADTLTRWLTGGAPEFFDLDDECELQNRQHAKNVIRCRNQELESNEVVNHIKAGKRVTQLAAVWRDGIRFVLGEDFAIRRVRFEDNIQSMAETDSEDAAAQFDQDFAVMSLQVGEFLDELMEAFGGPAD